MMKISRLLFSYFSVAKRDKQIPDLIFSYKGSPNLTRLAVSEMPKGRGRKGSKVPSRRRKTNAS